MPVFTAKGFVFGARPQFTDPADYLDYHGKQWHVKDMRQALSDGNLPNGLIIESEFGLSGVIVPDPAGGQMVEPLVSVLK